MEFCRKWK